MPEFVYASVAEANPKQIHVVLSEPIKDANTFTGFTVKADSQVVTIDSIVLADTNQLVINLTESLLKDIFHRMSVNTGHPEH